MRPKIVVGNWKMYTTSATARQLAEAVVKGVGSDTRVRVGVCPPAPYLGLVGEVLKGGPVGLGAQNVYPEKEGAFTGEIGLAMLQDLGCQYVIIGHSERRHKLGENDHLINRKVVAAVDAGLQVILCIGETLEEHKAHRTKEVLRFQLLADLARLKPVGLARVIIAYEPVWAIGTGINATPDQAQEAAVDIRLTIREQFGEESARSLLIQYGGSVTPDNAPSLMKLPDVDGGLIGGASLKPDQFLAIVRAAQ
jgi:triosephosphate isomerase